MMKNKAFYLEKTGLALFVILCLSAFVGNYVYLSLTSLSLIRVVIVCLLLFIFLLPRVKYDKLYYFTNGFFLIYTAHTIFMSLFYWENIALSHIFDYLFGFCLIWIVTTLIYSEPRRYISYFYKICLTLLVALSLLGWGEYLTDFHINDLQARINTANMELVSPYTSPILPTQDLIENDNFGNMPRLCFTNPNNFAFVQTLLLLFVLSYRKNTLQKTNDWLSICFILLTGSVSLLTHCRLSGAITLLYLLCYFRQPIFKFLKKYKIPTFILLTFTMIAVCGYFYFFHGASGLVRLNLYKYAFVSLFDSWLLGFGAKMELYYYNFVNNYDLFRHITNTHSFPLEMLISSGLLMAILYLSLFCYIEKATIKLRKTELAILPICYFILLFGPSSCISFWFHYIFFAVIVGYVHLEQQNQSLT